MGRNAKTQIVEGQTNKVEQEEKEEIIKTNFEEGYDWNAEETIVCSLKS